VLLLPTDDTTVGSGLTNNDPVFILGPDGRLLDEPKGLRRGETAPKTLIPAP
jgi:hypothetical protein